MNLRFLISLPVRSIGIILWGLMQTARREHQNRMVRKLKLPPSVRLGDVNLTGTNVTIGPHTYFNSGHLSSGPDAPVKIGSWCAIGYQVTILALTHDINFPTGPESQRPMHAAGVEIGDGTWIGNNVVITPGVKIGKQCVIGANAVVTKSIPDYAVAAGVPCRAVRIRSLEELEPHRQCIEKNL